MSRFTNPSEIARETLRQLAVRRVPPTPDNYRALYHEIAGTAATEDAFPDRFVRQLARRLPRDTAERLRLGRELDRALAANDGDAGREALDRYVDSLKAEVPPAWNELIGTLLRQWEQRQLGWTVARKREALDRVLGANDPHTLFGRLQALARAWGQSPADPEIAPGAEAPGMAPAAAPALPPVEQRAVADADGLAAGLRALVLVALETVVPAALGEDAQLGAEAAHLAQAARAAADASSLQTLAKQLKKFAWRLEMAAGDAAELRAGLLQLLRLVLENIDELVLDDRWLHGQVEMLREIVDKPLNVRLVDEAERHLKEVIYKQSQLKLNLAEAQRSLKEMLAGFVDQLARFAESTGTYHDRIGHCAQRIASARDITEIGPLLDEVMRETGTIQAHAQRARDELESTRRRADEAEEHVVALRRALDESSRLVRHDQLTGALNRRGLDEMLAKETARAARHRAPLAVALLDIDDFKALNDRLGHDAGDAALRQLAAAARANLRPQDTIARYGGEEFVILYPDTALDEATTALVRLQRELTRAFFLADNQKVMITFSGGLTAWRPGEAADAVLKRADAAMYQAKQSGKNKVVALPAEPSSGPAPASPAAGH